MSYPILKRPRAFFECPQTVLEHPKTILESPILFQNVLSCFRMLKKVKKLSTNWQLIV